MDIILGNDLHSNDSDLEKKDEVLKLDSTTQVNCIQSYKSLFNKKVSSVKPNDRENNLPKPNKVLFPGKI